MLNELRRILCRLRHRGADLEPSPVGGLRCRLCRAAFGRPAESGRLCLSPEEARMSPEWCRSLEARLRAVPDPGPSTPLNNDSPRPFRVGSYRLIVGGKRVVRRAVLQDGTVIEI